MFKKLSEQIEVIKIQQADENTRRKEYLQSQLPRFFEIVKRHLPIEEMPGINFLDTIENTFGVFKPGLKTIDIVIANRHPVDSLRTLAHELVHFKQLLKNEINMDSGMAGSPQENEANSVAGIIMRDFNTTHPECLLYEGGVGMFNKLMENANGGLSDGMTIDDIAEKHKTSIRSIEIQIEKGKKIEMEHTSDEKEAEKIAMDHLVEIPDYYDRLIKMEKEAEELQEAMLLLTEDEKAIKPELQKAMDFFGGKKVEGVDTNRFIRLGNMIRDNLKMELRVILKLLNPLNWPKAIFMSFYDVLKSFATLGTKESQELKIELQRFMVRIADGKYTGMSAKNMFADYNAIREKHGFKAYNFLQENVIRKDFNGEINRDFDGNIIDLEIEAFIQK
jgi:hypothetical protein